MKLFVIALNMIGSKDNMNDAKLAMDNEVKEDNGSSLHLNIDNKSDKLEFVLLNIADGFKLFGVDLQMHLNSRHKINISFETRVLDTSNTSISLTNQPIQNFHTLVELVSLGYVMYGNNWCSKHAIYPKGFKHAMYESH
jgi:hypothetical protein